MKAPGSSSDGTIDAMIHAVFHGTLSRSWIRRILQALPRRAVRPRAGLSGLAVVRERERSRVVIVVVSVRDRDASR